VLPVCFFETSCNLKRFSLGLKLEVSGNENVTHLIEKCQCVYLDLELNAWFTA
jgi:hypothetical protein